ncbi:Serine/threonine-protein kinase mos [Tetrabaena socialis]|uniref:Serine/threonine-protein kinase mos n=1 Tax=Tetrabaena socialis TaxID=47790 RepID=A0A2J7ZVQ5_9CHLO|nr:Serine/threonine-protein kinase mos [Tetrabaena socialis]|eukprot:PNH04340.1 Serine/threonine-protein kinase mos [Tetrabaena socialis]
MAQITSLDMEQATKQAITAACGAVAMAAGHPGSCGLLRLRNICACLDDTLGAGGTQAWILVFGAGGHTIRTACAFSADAPPIACDLAHSAALYDSLCQENAWTVIRKRPNDPSSLYSGHRNTPTAQLLVETWPAGSLPALEAGDTLALPLHRQYGQPGGALLMGAASCCFAQEAAAGEAEDGIRRSNIDLEMGLQRGWLDASGKWMKLAGQQQQELPKASALMQGVASEALRLAQFIGLAVFGDATQAASLVQVVFGALRTALTSHPILSAEWGHLTDPHRHEQPRQHRDSTSTGGMTYGTLNSPRTGGAPRGNQLAREVSVRRVAAISSQLARLRDSKSGKQASSLAGGSEDAVGPSGYSGDQALFAQTSRIALGMASCPVLEVEEAAGLRPLELLVSSARNRITAMAFGSEGGEAARLTASQDLAAVQLHEVIGRGGQGVIFRGALHGLECAVKVLEHGGLAPLEHEGVDEASLEAAGGARGQFDGGRHEPYREAAAGRNELGTSPRGVEHIRQAKRGALEVAVFAQFSEVMVAQRKLAKGGHTLRLCALDDPVAVANSINGKTAGPRNSVLCLEYCDCGSLADAVRRGDFRLPGSGSEEGPMWPSLVPLYTSLLEVALSLRYLHSRRLVHCDLKPQNVLLKSTTRDARGWSCKLSDFGCVRLMDETGGDGQPGFTATMVCGTVPYMSPGRLQGPAIDIYSFGVLMWELMHGRAPFGDVNWKDVPALVVRQGARPVFHPLAPQEYSALASRCWSPYPEQRPVTGQLVLKLQRLLTAAQASDTAALTQWQQLHPSLATAQVPANARTLSGTASGAGGAACSLV